MVDVLYLKRGDTAPPFRAQCLDGDTPLDLTEATSAKLKIKDPAGALILDANLTIENQTANPGWVRRTWQTADTDTTGVHRCEVEITWGDGTKQTFPADSYSSIVIVQDLG